MSHDATNWAIKQRGFKPATKFVLWHLCDRYHPDNGCFPSQETLADDCELSRSALNEHLAILETAGLIAREQRREKGSKQQLSTRYRFAFEAGFAPVCAEKPCPESGHGSDGEAVSGNDAEPCPENGQSRVRNPDSNLVREPVIEPVNDKKSASEHGQEHDDAKRMKAKETRFWALVAKFPNFAGRGKENARRAWFALTDDEQDDAERRFPDWLKLLEKSGGGGQYTPAPSTYFGEKLFREVPERPAEPAKPKIAAPFGKAWGALRMEGLLKPMRTLPALTALEERIIEQSPEKEALFWQDKKLKHGWPQVVAMHDQASAGRGVVVPQRAVSLGEDFQQVMVGGELWEAWKRFHAARSWPWLPDTGKQGWVWFPAVEDGTDDLESAVAAAVHGFRRKVEGHEYVAAE